VRALNDCGDGSLDSILAAFGYAVGHGADIVVASFATDPWLLASDKATIRQAFKAFFVSNPNTLFVVAAGNDGNDNDLRAVYPCNSSVDVPNVICVAASNRDDSPRCTSNYGGSSVSLFAPGESIWTTVGPNATTALSGTSMAAPMVAGAAALVEAVDPGASPDTVVTALLGSVDQRAAMQGISAAGGRLNAGAATGATTHVANPAQGSPCFDADHDGVNNATDACRTDPGTGPQGCPDADGDEVIDSADNCPQVYNPSQADADGDRAGDACDDTPRGADADGDGVGALDDRCPTQPANTANGCPAVVATPTPPPVVTPAPTPTPTPTVTPVVPPRIVSVGVKVAHNRKTARVTVRLTRTASTKVTVERRVKHHWARVTTRSFSATARGRALTVRTPKRGSYRVTVALAGARTVRRSFRV
jgi:hypothetical protein